MQSAILALASNLVYEARYKLTWWQWLFFPILSRRLSSLQGLVRKGLVLDVAQRKTLQKTVIQLEFGKRAPPAYIIALVRQNILHNELNNWQVRQAFNSFALRNHNDRLQRRLQPQGVHVVSVLAFWVFAAFSTLMFSGVVIDSFFTPCLPLPYNQFIVLFYACAVATLFCYQLGYQWRHGDRVMQRIWPTPTLHVSGWMSA